MLDTTARHHPYYPRDLVLNHYVTNTNSVALTLVYVSLTFIALVFLASALAYPRRHSTLQSPGDRLVFFWFILNGFLHLVFEGYFGINHATLAADQSPIGQVWKEYALSDSRYLSSDTFVLITERITILVWGPLALYGAWSLYHNLPSRYIVQLMLSLGHIYGCVLYYFTSIFEGSPHCDPDPYYYYFYFWFFNVFWLIVPTVLMIGSFKALQRAMASFNNAE